MKGFALSQLFTDALVNAGFDLLNELREQSNARKGYSSSKSNKKSSRKRPRKMK